MYKKTNSVTAARRAKARRATAIKTKTIGFGAAHCSLIAINTVIWGFAFSQFHI